MTGVQTCALPIYLWLSVGYNRFGFRDDDLASEGYTNKGVFLRLRYKFDENLLN